MEYVFAKIEFCCHNNRSQIAVFLNSLWPSYRTRHIRVLCTDHCVYVICVLEKEGVREGRERQGEGGRSNLWVSEWVSQRVSVLMCVVLTTLCVGVGKIDE